MKKKALAALCAAVMLCAGCGTPTETTAAAEAPAGTGETQENTPVNENDISSLYEWGNVEIVGGGYTSGIYYNKAEKGLVYARTDIGGFYRMDNSTGRWKPLTDRFGEDDYSYYGIDGCAVDEKEPNKVYILAGMYKGWKAAVLCSDDYGDTWRITPLEFAAGGNEPNRFADRLVIDPNDSTTLYVCSRKDGLWVSHDSGASFSKVESFPTLGLGYGEDGYTFGITAVAFAPGSSAEGEPCKTIYAGTGDKSVYVSRDGGSTWEELEGAPKSYLPCHIYVRDNYVYFVMNSKAGPYQINQGALKRYDSSNGEWTDITPDDKGHGWGDLEIDPNDPKTIYASTMGKWGGNENDNIFRSKDGGLTWDSLFTGDGNDRKFSIDISGAPWLDWGTGRAKLGWMIGDIEIDPFNSDEIMYGTGATIYRSVNLTDWGSSEIKFEVRCAGLEETAVLSLAAANSDDIRLYSAMGDIDGFTHKDVDKVPDHMNGNGSMTTARYITCAYNAPLVAARTGDGNYPISVTPDGGETWTNVNKPKGVGGDCGTVALSCDGSVLYWTNTSAAAIYRSDDYGKNWEKLDRAFARAKIAADCFNKDVLYVYTSGMFYTSTDGGKTFTAAEQYIPDGCKLTPSPEKEGEVWLATPIGGVFRITDYGKGELVRTSLKSAKCFAVGASKDANSPMTLYAIGENDGVSGIWRSCDSGETWQRINDDMHQFGAIGESLAADLRVFGQIYLGTNGRGVIEGRERSR